MAHNDLKVLKELSLKVDRACDTNQFFIHLFAEIACGRVVSQLKGLQLKPAECISVTLVHLIRRR